MAERAWVRRERNAAFRAFLTDANLEAYVEGFIEQGYETLEDLAYADEADVRACGVGKRGHLARALRAIEGLHSDDGDASRRTLRPPMTRRIPPPVRTSPLRATDSGYAPRAKTSNATAFPTTSTSSCCICYDDKPADSGVACLQGDFTCAECLEQHARTQNPDPSRPNFALMRDHGREDGSLYCPRHPTAFGFRASEGVRGGCNAPAFSDQLLARHLSESTFNGYLAVKMKCGEQRVFEQANAQWQRQLHSIQAQLGDRKLKLDRGILAEQLKRQFPNAYMCPRCQHGPIDHMACAQLSTHHGQKMSGTKARVNNACPNCGWFSKKIEDWPRWGGVLPEEVDAAGVQLGVRSYRANARRRARSQTWRETGRDTDRNRRRLRAESARSSRTRSTTNRRHRYWRQCDDDQLERALRLSRASMATAVTAPTVGDEDTDIALAIQRSLTTNVTTVAADFVEELDLITIQTVEAGERETSDGAETKTNVNEQEAEDAHLKSTEPPLPPPPVPARDDDKVNERKSVFGIDETPLIHLARARDRKRRERVAARVRSQQQSSAAVALEKGKEVQQTGEETEREEEPEQEPEQEQRNNRRVLSSGRRKLALARLAIRERGMESGTPLLCSTIPLPTLVPSEGIISTIARTKVFRKPYNTPGKTSPPGEYSGR